MTFACPLLDQAQVVLTHMAPGMPPAYMWVTALVLFLLALTATIDAFTSIVPDVFIFIGLVGVVATQGLVSSWEIALWNLGNALVFGAAIWAINFAWYRKFGYDALGMGDAKWSMLAVACFGNEPVLFSWGAGAVFATAFIGAARLFRYQVTKVTFAPFLLMGLGLGLYWIRFR